MSEKYIKRQLVLSELGIPMNKQINDYYNHFNSLLGNKEDLILDKKESYTQYYKNGNRILEYSESFGFKNFHILDYLWEDFGMKFNIDNERVRFLLLTFLNHTFNKDAETVYPSKFYDYE